MVLWLQCVFFIKDGLIFYDSFLVLILNFIAMLKIGAAKEFDFVIGSLEIFFKQTLVFLLVKPSV